MSTETSELVDRSTADGSSAGSGVGLWLLGTALLAIALGLAAGITPARLRLYYLFPLIHGLLLARLSLAFRRQLTDWPFPRWAPVWIAVLAGISVGLGGWQAGRNWQQSGGGRIEPGAALARQMVRQMPTGDDGVDPELRREMLQELEASPSASPFQRWLTARAGGAASPRPELLWGSELLCAMLGALIWLRFQPFHAPAGGDGKQHP